MYKIAFSLFSLLLLASFSIAQDNLPRDFSRLLKQANMAFEQPAGMESVPVIDNVQMNYEYALRFTDKRFEVRYAIRPLEDLLKDFEQQERNKKKGDINISPNTFYNSLMLVTLLNISGGRVPADGTMPEIIEFDPQAVKEEFNADWGATAIVEVGPEFGQEYVYCMVVALHKDNFADAYYFYLADTTEGFQDLIMPAFHSLTFKK